MNRALPARRPLVQFPNRDRDRERYGDGGTRRITSASPTLSVVRNTAADDAIAEPPDDRFADTA